MDRRRRVIRSIALGCALGTLALPTFAATTPAPGQAVDAVLSAHVAPGVRSDVMVFGTAHLRAFEGKLEPRHMEETLALLGRYAPTRIAVERLAPDEIALLRERAPHDAGARTVLEQFAQRIVGHGQAAQELLGIDRSAARAAAETTLGRGGDLADAARIELVTQLLAAYEYDSAVLQWSYLDPDARAQATRLPEAAREALEASLVRFDEIAQLAIPLARALGLQRVYPVDSQYEAVRTLGLPEDALEEATGVAWGVAWRASEERGRLDRANREVVGGGDVLGLFHYFNSEAGQRDDAAQWRSWLGQDREDGVHRFRYAMWELRNQRMAANVMDVAASQRPERVLFIVGTSHKAFVDRALAPHLGIRLVQPFDPEVEGQGGGP